MDATKPAELQDALIAALTDLLDDDLPSDAPELERVACTLLVVLDAEELPETIATAVVRQIAQRGDRAASGLLAAIAAFARGPVAGVAAQAAARLAAAGVAAPAGVGALKVTEALRFADGELELLAALLRRPRGRRLQVALLSIETAETGGALMGVLLSPPLPATEARELLAEATASAGAPAPTEITAGELAARAVAAARRTDEEGIPLDHEAAMALPVVARALTGEAGGMARPDVLAPWEDDDLDLIVDAAEDEDRYFELVEQLRDEFEAFARARCDPAGAVWRSGDFVVDTLLQFKGGYSDGALGRWRTDDLAEFLLDHFPRKVVADDETLADVPECVLAFLGFLADRGSLSGDPLPELEAALDELRDDFAAAARDPARWGLAKSLLGQAAAEGVDPTDPDALDGWIDDFNQRPDAERDAVLGPALGSARAGGARPKKRKQQKAARKRNRKRR